MNKVVLHGAALAALVALAVACGGEQTPSPTAGGATATPAYTPAPTGVPTPAATPAPTYTPAPTATVSPTAVPTPLPSPSEPDVNLTGEQMAAIVLSREDVKAEFPFVQFDPEDTGDFVANADAADNTLDPSDTAADMGAAGRITGYVRYFVNVQGMTGGSDGGPILVESEVHVFEHAAGAADFLALLARAPGKFEDVTREAGTLRSVATLAMHPALGEEASGFQARQEVPELGVSLPVFGAVWRRGAAVLTVFLAGAPGSDHGAAAARLAAIMDLKVRPAMAGEIVAQAQAAEPGGRNAAGEEGPGPERQALDQGYDLRSLSDLGSLLPGFQVYLVNFSWDGAEIRLEREYSSESFATTVGDSAVISVNLVIDLYATPLEAALPVRTVAAMEPNAAAGLFGFDAQAGRWEGPDDAPSQARKLEVAGLGDEAAGISAVFGAPPLEFQAHIFFFARGRLGGYTLILGTDLQIEDTMSLAAEIDSRAAALPR